MQVMTRLEFYVACSREEVVVLWGDFFVLFSKLFRKAFKYVFMLSASEPRIWLLIKGNLFVLIVDYSSNLYKDLIKKNRRQ